MTNGRFLRGPCGGGSVITATEVITEPGDSHGAPTLGPATTGTSMGQTDSISSGQRMCAARHSCASTPGHDRTWRLPPRRLRRAVRGVAARDLGDFVPRWGEKFRRAVAGNAPHGRTVSHASCRRRDIASATPTQRQVQAHHHAPASASTLGQACACFDACHLCFEARDMGASESVADGKQKHRR